jgi:putative serine protease PepD
MTCVSAATNIESMAATDALTRGDGDPARRDPLLPRIAVVTLLAALLGAGVLAALLFATGSIGSTTTVTNVTQRPVSGGSAATAPLNAPLIYQDAAPGVLAITATGVSTPEGRATAAGTGFVIDSQGDVLTASHVVDGASSITVRLQGGTTRGVRVLGVDRSIDAAVLRVGPSGLALHPLPLGSSGSLAVGSPLAVIGDPFGFNRSLSTGIVSGVGRTIQAPNGNSVPNAIQTDAAIDPGNSGGPVLTAQGQVVGITDQIATGSPTTDSSTGVGFAVPIDAVKAELPQLKRGVHVVHAALGVGTGESPTQAGALVQSVAAGNGAAATGLRVGDVITAVDGAVVSGPNALVAAIAAHRPGEKLALTVHRGTRTLTLTATLRPAAA